MNTMKRIERLGKRFEATEDKNLRTSFMRRMICMFLNLIFWMLLRNKKATKEEMMKSCKKDDMERIIEQGENYIIVEWQVVSKEEERAKQYNINDIYLYCKIIFDKGIVKKIEVE